MQQVPQFIEIEDKIFGPLTFKQFVYLAGGAGLSFTLWTLLPKFIAVLLIIPVFLFSVALAFYKINRKPFIFIISSAIQYFTNSKLYIWKKTPKKIERTKKQGSNETEGSVDELTSFVPKLSDSKLKDLAWSLGVKDSIYAEQEGRKNNNKAMSQ